MIYESLESAAVRFSFQNREQSKSFIIDSSADSYAKLVVFVTSLAICKLEKFKLNVGD